MVWIGGRDMNFLFYMSALSLLYVMETDHVYIHGDVEPGGMYWLELKQNEKITFVSRPQPNLVYGQELGKLYKALMSDVLRVDIMINYGGLYCDTDTIWTHKLSREERGYDAVAAYDWVDWSYPFPDSVNFGVSYGKRNAPFWRIFRETLRYLNKELHGYAGVMMPYKLKERYPHLLRIDPHLQAICYRLRCHPTWVDNYHNISNNHVSANSIPNWRTDLHALHFTHPDPEEYKDKETLIQSEGMFAEIGKNVLKKAGLL